MKKIIMLIILLIGMASLNSCLAVSFVDTDTGTIKNTNTRAETITDTEIDTDTDIETGTGTGTEAESSTNNVVEMLESLGLTKELAEHNAEIFSNVGITYLSDITAGPGSGIYDLQYYVCGNYGAKNFALSFTFENGYLFRIVFSVYPVFKDDEGFNAVLYYYGEYKNKIVYDENGQIGIEEIK